MPPKSNPVVDELAGLLARKHHIEQKSRSDSTSQPPQKRPRREPSFPFALRGLSSQQASGLSTELRNLASRCVTANFCLLPQCGDYSQWPNVTAWERRLPTDIVDSVREDAKAAWLLIISGIRCFFETDLFPFVDGILKSDPFRGSSVLVAFVGVHQVIESISAEISSMFSNVIVVDSALNSHSKRDVDFEFSDLLEEIDLQSFMHVPQHTSMFTEDSFSGTALNFTSTPVKSALRNAFDTPRTEPRIQDNFRSDFVSGCKATKRRRAMTPEVDDTMESHSSISTGIERNEPARSTPDGKMNAREFGSEERDCTLLSDEEFFDELIPKEDSIFRYLSGYVQKHFSSFPAVAPEFIHHIVEAYEFYLRLVDCTAPQPAGSPDDILLLDIRIGMDAFHDSLFRMNLSEQIIAPALQILCHKRMRQQVADCLKHSDGMPGKYLQEPTHFTSLKIIASFIRSILYRDAAAEHPNNESIFNLLVDYAKQEYIKNVVDRFFDLLLQWPRSRSNFMELKMFMDDASIDVIYEIIVSLQRQFRSKLLRPGLNTLDILAVYTAAIRALRIIDPSRVIQDLVCEPVRMYLRSRPDTVRCIMSHITHISSSREVPHRRSSLPALDMMIEEEEAAIALSMLNVKATISDIDLDNWKTWQPDPIYAEMLPTSARTDRQADTIELLMSIYGGQDVFINEYQLILAEKLLGYYAFDAEEESRHLKMMTKRFGESLLQRSEVMSRDASDSQKFHQRILEKLQSDSDSRTIPFDIPLKTLVISHNYWPEIRTEKLKTPDVLGKAMVKYKQHFEDVSVSRTVDVRPELGHVKFDLMLDDGRKMSVKCNPVYAAIILKFVEQQRWPVDDLADALGVSTILLKRKLTYWQRRNVIEESEPDLFSIVADGAFLSDEDLARMEDDEIESAVRYVAENNQDEQNLQMQLQMFWKYMTTMLNTIQTITIDRLFSMVRMFIIRGQTKRDVTIDHLRQFLDTKVRARELVFSNSRYSLPKKDEKPKGEL